MPPKNVIVISAVNLTSGGPLSILNDCLSALDGSTLSIRYRIIAIVHDKKLAYYPNIEYLELPAAKRNWANRLYYEYVYFNKISVRYRPHLWLSLHDTTPNVRAGVRAVYCHNPMAFYRPSIDTLKYSYKEYFFSLLYKYLYRINIRKNDFVIVQQKWLKDLFGKHYSLKPSKIIVAPPNNRIQEKPVPAGSGNRNTIRFFYPALPRTFKNFETICEACKILNERNISDYEVILTLNGRENGYSRYIYDKYHTVKHLKFHGLLSRDRTRSIYADTSCLIFPSKLETWGLPISEFAPYDRPMIIANLPYAHETAAGANRVAFFDPDSPSELAARMSEVIDGNMAEFKPCPKIEIGKPQAHSWLQLFDILLQ